MFVEVFPAVFSETWRRQRKCGWVGKFVVFGIKYQGYDRNYPDHSQKLIDSS